MCPGAGIPFSCPRISQSGNRRPIGRDAGSAGGSAWKDGGYLCTGVCPCWIFPAVLLQVSEATDLGAFISLKPAFNNNKLRASADVFAHVWSSDKWLLVVLPGEVRWRFMGHITSLQQSWRQNQTLPSGVKPANKNK